VFVGGGAHDPQFDSDEEGLERLEEELDGLEGSVVAKFEETKVESDQAWKALCSAHAMVSLMCTDDGLLLSFLCLTISSQSMELRDCSLRHVSEVAQNHMSTFKIEHDGVGSSIDIANKQISTLQSAKNDIEGARASLEEGSHQNESAKLAANIGVSQSSGR
jgi:hypothetical protein